MRRAFAEPRTGAGPSPATRFKAYFVHGSEGWEVACHITKAQQMLRQVERLRADAPLANLVVALCPPLTVLFCSDLPLLANIGHFAVAVAAIAALASLLLSGKKPSIYAVLIGATIAGLIAAGSVSAGLATTQAYVQVAVLSMFGIIVSDFRRVVAGLKFYVISLLLVSLVLMINFTPSAVTQLIEFNRNWSSPVFVNPNVFGMCCAVLTIFAFMSSKVVASSRMTYLSYLLCGMLVFFIAASGSRTALLMVIVFFSIYMSGKAFKGNKILLGWMATLALVMVPVVTIGLPIALGAHIHFVPTPTPPGVASKTPPPDNRIGGFLGLKKHIDSGRQNIWPVVIELSGLSPIWGHGLATSPAPYLASPYAGHAHNGFLQVYYQFGLIGVGLYTFLWCLLFIRAVGVLDISARSAAVAVICAACVEETFEIHPGVGIALGILATTEFTSSAMRVVDREDRV